MSGLHARPTLLRKSIPLIVSLWVAACFLLISKAASAVGPQDEGTLMFVREWDPKTGELVGWLPIHRAAIRLVLVESRTPTLALNDTVKIQWLPRSDLDPTTGQVIVSPKPRTFEGERWLPVKRDSNVVRVAKRLFLIQSIILGESRWRLPNQAGFLSKNKN